MNIQNMFELMLTRQILKCYSSSFSTFYAEEHTSRHKERIMEFLFVFDAKYLNTSCFIHLSPLGLWVGT